MPPGIGYTGRPLNPRVIGELFAPQTARRVNPPTAMRGGDFGLTMSPLSLLVPGSIYTEGMRPAERIGAAQVASNVERDMLAPVQDNQQMQAEAIRQQGLAALRQMQESQFARELGLREKEFQSQQEADAELRKLLSGELGGAAGSQGVLGDTGPPNPITGPRANRETTAVAREDAERDLSLIASNPNPFFRAASKTNPLAKLLFNPIGDPFSGSTAEIQGAINRIVKELESETDPLRRSALVNALVEMRNSNKRFGAIMLRDDTLDAFGKEPRFKGTSKLLDLIEQSQQ